MCSRVFLGVSATDYKGEVNQFMPQFPVPSNGKKVALLGAGPASLGVARDLLPFGIPLRSL